MSNPNEFRPNQDGVVVTDEPVVIQREEIVVRERANSGWWIAALVAIVAIVGLVYIFTSNRGPTDEDLQAARDQGAIEATIANSQLDAQAAATQASIDAQLAAASTARATEQAAMAAAAQTAQATAAAQSAAQAAASAAASAAAAAQPPTPLP